MVDEVFRIFRGRCWHIECKCLPGKFKQVARIVRFDLTVLIRRPSMSKMQARTGGKLYMASVSDREVRGVLLLWLFVGSHSDPFIPSQTL